MLVGLIALVAVATATLGWVLANHTDAAVPYWDSATTTMSFAAMWMTARKHIENWIVWLVVDVVATGIYLVQRSRDVCAAVLRLYRHGVRGMVGMAAIDAANRGGLTVAMVGAECSGKTTLAEGWRGASTQPWVPEYAREYLAARASYDRADVLAIAKGQYAPNWPRALLNRC